MAPDHDGVPHRDVGTDRSDRTADAEEGVALEDRLHAGVTPCAAVHQRSARSTRAGSRCRSPVCWSIWGIAQRGHGVTTRSVAAPTRTSVQVSSAHGSLPVSTRLGRNRSMPNGSDACARRCSSEAVAVTRIGAASLNGAACPKTSSSSGSRHPPGSAMRTRRTGAPRSAENHPAASSPASRAGTGDPKWERVVTGWVGGATSSGSRPGARTWRPPSAVRVGCTVVRIGCWRWVMPRWSPSTTCHNRSPASPIAETVAAGSSTARHDLIGWTKIDASVMLPTTSGSHLRSDRSDAARTSAHRGRCSVSKPGVIVTIQPPAPLSAVCHTPGGLISEYVVEITAGQVPAPSARVARS